MKDKEKKLKTIEESIYKAAIGYEYEENQIKANKRGNTTEIKKVKKQKGPDIKAAALYLNMFRKK